MRGLVIGFALVCVSSMAVGQAIPKVDLPQNPSPRSDPPQDRRTSGGVGIGGIGLSIKLGGKKKAPVAEPLPMEMRDQPIAEYVADQAVFVIVGQPANAAEIARLARVTIIETSWLDESNVTMIVAQLAASDTVPAAIARLSRQRGVSWAQPNYQFQLLGRSRPRRFDLHAIPRNQDRVSGKIVMIDGGVDTSHDNLRGAVVSQQFFGPDNLASVHGTAIAALLVGTGNYPGTAQGAQLTSLAAFSGTASDVSRTSYLARAMNQASKLRPDVLNLSFGGPIDRLLGVTLDTIHRNGVCVAAAAGNGGPNGNVLFPATHPQSLAVTAVDESLRSYSYASQGNRIDVAGVGVGLNVAAPGGRRAVSGTSFATAVVSGALLRMPACNGGRNPANMKAQVATRAQDLGPVGHDPIFGAGLFRLSGAGR